MDFLASVAYLDTLRNRGWRLGLDRMVELLRLAGDPQLAGPRFIHVAGTNGKGSVTRMIDEMLAASGRSVGGYYSPYVYSIRERVTLNCSNISEELFAQATTALRPFAEQLEPTEYGGPTEFELKTAMAFWVYAHEQVEFVALETGLGGRLDATNVVQPVVSVITEIGLDHQQYLGETAAEIACEKAGIIKPGVPCVSGVTDPDSLVSICGAADEKGCELWNLGGHFSYEQTGGLLQIKTPKRVVSDVSIGLKGRHQARNAAVAVAALDAAGIEVSDSAVRSGLANARLPGRLEVVRTEPLVVFDGAHNEQAADAVGSALGSFSLVYSCATGHDPRPVLSVLGARATEIQLCQMQSDRGLGLDEIIEAARQLGLTFTAHATVAGAVGAALAENSSRSTILVTGSFYLLAEAKAALADT